MLAPGKGNYVRFRLSPDVTIAVGARVKQPGRSRWSARRPSCRSSTSRDGDEMDAYERLLGDAMDGDPTLFARQDAVEAAWAIVDPMLARPDAGARIRARHVGTARGRGAAGGGRRVAEPGDRATTYMKDMKR